MFADQKIQNSNRPTEYFTKSEECIPSGLQQFFSISEDCCSSCSNITSSIEEKLKTNKNNNNNKKNLVKQCSLTAVLKNNCDDIIIDDPDSDSLHCKKCPLITCKNKYNELQLGSKLQDELLNYKKELREYNNTTKDLEEKYKKLNIELCEMQKSHERFISSHKEDSSKNSNISITNMNMNMNKESECIFKDTSRQSSREDLCCPYHLASTFLNTKDKISSISYTDDNGNGNGNLNSVNNGNNCNDGNVIDIGITSSNYDSTLKEHNLIKSKIKNNDSITKASNTSLTSQKAANIKDFYAIVQSVLHSKDITTSVKEDELKYLQAKVTNLQHEHDHYKNIIDQQNDCLRDYHSRCLKAQYILKSQQIQIEKLNSNNQQLETEITKGIDDLRFKIDSKLKDISKLPQIMREEQQKYEKICKENHALAERLKALQDEANQLKMKVEELAKKKAGTITRLKTTERDLKIFKNYNVALKHEKRRLCEELQRVKDQLDAIQHSSKRTLTRQREQSEKQRRDLQKRLFELELKISRSKNSTTSLIQERDNLIAELQTQLNTLVHNFEVSQKHIRVLRRHIYSMTGSNPI